jgi:hypothetical protein
MNENELWYVINGILDELEYLKQIIKELEKKIKTPSE